MGCATSRHFAVIENHKLIKKGLYEVNTLSDAWVRSPRITTIHDFYVDLTHARCPGTQSVFVMRQGWDPFSPQTFEELLQSYTRLLSKYGGLITETLSKHPIHVSEYEAVELQYNTRMEQSFRAMNFCTSGERGSGFVKAKDVVILISYSKLIVFSYTSPPETLTMPYLNLTRWFRAFTYCGLAMSRTGRVPSRAMVSRPLRRCDAISEKEMACNATPGAQSRIRSHTLMGFPASLI